MLPLVANRLRSGILLACARSRTTLSVERPGDHRGHGQNALKETTLATFRAALEEDEFR